MSDLKICVSLGKIAAEPWVASLQAHLPEAEIFLDTEGAPQADFAFVWAPDESLFERQAALKAVFNAGAGIDALAKLANYPRAAIPLVRLEDAGMAEQMCEYSIHAVLRFVREFDAYDATRAQNAWVRRAPRSRRDFPIGILGAGALGSAVARAFVQMGFSVSTWSRSAKVIDGVRCFAGAESLMEFASASRILICLLPLTAETENIIDAKLLGALQSGAYVINLGRGFHVVDDDLLAAIESGQLAGGALDVFRQEPLPAEHPFWACSKLSLTPHISAATLRDECTAQVAKKIRQVQAGLAPAALSGVIDWTKGY
jgi:glyoxylate/hydroxypyruvate reductase